MIRKAIKLALQNPDEQEYGDFLDQLCAIYDDAKELRYDQAANDTQAAAETEAIIAKLQARVTELCRRYDEVIVKPKTDGDESLEASVVATPKHTETLSFCSEN